MSDRAECEVCEGLGYYPIIDRWGTEQYSIACPECHGAGTMSCEPVDAEDPDLPPPSTASRMKSIDDLKAWQQKELGL